MIKINTYCRFKGYTKIMQVAGVLLREGKLYYMHKENVAKWYPAEDVEKVDLPYTEYARVRETGKVILIKEIYDNEICHFVGHDKDKFVYVDENNEVYGDTKLIAVNDFRDRFAKVNKFSLLWEIGKVYKIDEQCEDYAIASDGTHLHYREIDVYDREDFKVYTIPAEATFIVKCNAGFKVNTRDEEKAIAYVKKKFAEMQREVIKEIEEDTALEVVDIRDVKINERGIK